MKRPAHRIVSVRVNPRAAMKAHTAMELLDIAESMLDRAYSYGDEPMRNECSRIAKRLQRQKQRLLAQMDRALGPLSESAQVRVPKENE